jgi:hypothetical protein
MAMVGAGVALDAADVVGDTVGAGVATHADTESDTASARTQFFNEQIIDRRARADV